MLYLAELLNQDPKFRFGYADNICLYRATNSLDTNAELLAQNIHGIIVYGNENKIFFVPEKLKMIHLTQRQGTSAPLCKVNDNLVIMPIIAALKAGQPLVLR